MLLARLSASGRPVRSFGRGGVVEARFPRRLACGCAVGATVVEKGDGDLLLSGTASISTPGSSVRHRRPQAAIAEFTRSGAIETAFGDEGLATLPGSGASFGHDLRVGAGGEIIQAEAIESEASRGHPEFAVSRFRANGALDRSFAHHGTLRRHLAPGGSEAWALAPTAKGMVVAGLARTGAGKTRRVSTVLASLLAR